MGSLPSCRIPAQVDIGSWITAGRGGSSWRSVNQLPKLSAIDRVVGVGCAVTADTVVDTRDFVRPVYADGLLTLHVTPAAAGSVVPLEVEGGHVC